MNAWDFLTACQLEKLPDSGLSSPRPDRHRSI